MGINHVQDFSGFQGAICNKLVQTIENTLHPIYFELHNESKNHSLNPNGETHLKIVVVSPDFKDLGLLQRHRLIHTTLSEDFMKQIHSLSIAKAITPDQWEKEGGTEIKIDPSPRCMGGSKKEK